MSISVEQAANQWIIEVEKKRRLNKEARRAVMSFAIWLDGLIDQSEKEEEEHHGKQN